MARPLPELHSKLGIWLKRNSCSIAQMARDTNLSYRTCWLAARGVRVAYASAEAISAFTARAVPIQALCSGTPRNQLANKGPA